MKKLLLVTGLVLTLLVNVISVNANDRMVDFKEAFPNESLRNYISMITRTDEDADKISLDVLEEIEDIDLRSDVQLNSFEELSLLVNLNDVMLRYQYNLKDLEGIEYFEHLESLFVAYSSLESIDELEHLKSLNKLMIINPSSSFALREDALDVLKDLELQTLHLNNVGLTDEKISVIKDMTSLTRLDLSTYYEQDSDIPESDWVVSLDSTLSNKLSHADFASNLHNLEVFIATDNQFKNIDGLSNKKESLTDVSINTPRFGKPFSNASSVTDLSEIFVADNYNSEGITFMPLLTQYVTEELHVNFDTKQYYVDLVDLKPFNIILSDGSVDKARVEIDEKDVPVHLEEINGTYRVTWNIEDSLNFKTVDGFERLFEIDMFDKDQRHATFIYSVRLPETSVTVHHVDEYNNPLIEPQIYKNLYNLGMTYETFAKEFEFYQLKVLPKNYKGVVNKSHTEVVYEYVRKHAGDVIVHHVDTNNNKIDTDRYIDGTQSIGLTYNTYIRDIPNYTILEIPDNAEGVFNEEEQHVTYVYNLNLPSENIPKEEDDLKVEEIPVETANENKPVSNTPQTGISSDLILYTNVFLISLLVLMSIKRRKNS